MNEYVTTATFLFSLALVNAGLAEQKNRGRWNWFLLSLVLGPIATAIIVIADPLAPKTGTFSESVTRYRSAKRAAAERTP